MDKLLVKRTVIDYMMDNYPDIFFDKSGNLKQNGGMI